MATSWDVRLDPKNRDKKTTLDPNGYVIETFSERYTIEIDSGTSDNAETVEAGAQASGTPIKLPSIGDSHGSRGNATVDSVNTKCLGVTHYESTVTYKTPSYESGGGGGDQSPLNQPAKIRFYTAYEQMEIDHDYNGNPIMVPRTREAYSLMTEKADLGCSIQKAVPTFEPLSVYRWTDKTNQDSFLGFPPGTAKCYTIEATTAKQGDMSYWDLNVNVLFREPVAGRSPAEAWYQRVVRKGLYAMDTNDQVQRIGLKNDGSYVAYPRYTSNAVQTRVFLNNDSEILLTSEDPVFDPWQTKGKFKFSNMGLF